MEMVDLYDENRLPLGRTAERYAPKGEGEYRVVVHICVFDSRGRLLIQQRSREKAVWPAAWMPERPAARRRSGSSGRSWAWPWT